MVIVLVEIITANTQLGLNFKHTLCCLSWIRLVDIRHHIHVVDKAKDRRGKRDVN